MIATRFDVDFGQRLCDLLSAELGFVCNFMDGDGRIVASGDITSIGCFQHVAARIMRGELDEYGVTADEAAQSATMREGINMGIDVDGTRLISLGIVGPLEIVRPLARFVRFSVTSLLRIRHQEALFEQCQASLGLGATPHAQPKTASASSLSELLRHASESFWSSLVYLRDAVDNIDQGITMFDAQMRLVVWNRRFLQLIDMPEETISFGMPLEAVVRFYAEHVSDQPDEIEAMIASRLGFLRTRTPSRFQQINPKGLMLEIKDRPLPNGGFVSTYTDITRSRRIERELREAFDNAERLVEERTGDLKNFVELSTDWFWEQDTELRFTRFYGKVNERLKLWHTDFMGKRRWDMPIQGVTPEDLAAHIATCERHEPFHDFDYQIQGEDGTTQYYSISGEPVFDREGVFAGYHGVGHNVTEIRVASLKIKESKRYLSQIVDGSPIPTFVIDVDQKVTHWNRACAMLTEVPADQMLGRTDVWRAFYDSPRPVLANLLISGALDEVLDSGNTHITRSSVIEGAIEAQAFYPQMGTDGRWLYFVAAPLRDTEGKIIGVIETLQDVTEKYLVQRLLEERSAVLEKSHAELEVRVAERTAALSQQLNFVQQLIEAIPGPVFYKDAQERYLGCNSAFEVYLGLPASSLLGKTVHDLFPPQIAGVHSQAERELYEKPGSKVYESQIRHANGELREVMMHKATFTQPDGSIGGMVGMMLDITERKRMEIGLRQAATVFDNSAEGVTIANPDGSILAVNRAFTEITGYQEHEVVGKNPRILQSGRHGKSFYHQMWDSIKQNGRWQGEVWNRRKNGEVYPEWISITAVHDKQNRLTNYVATFSDITQQKLTEEKIQLLAFTDPLTALPNRRLLLDRLKHALEVSARNKRHGALFFIDPDDFKGLNDTRGHYVGDLLLKQVAERIVACVRKGDTVARFGGDEFVVMLEDLSSDLLEAMQQTEIVGIKILQVLNEPYLLVGSPHHNTPSIGATLFGSEKNVLEEVLKQADLAMYQAKSSGRNGLRFFDPDMQSAVAVRVEMETDLRRGLLEHQFLLHYQPQVDHTSHLTGAEALVRWKHPQRGMVSPAHFIPFAEESGLILPLGQWVLEKACEQLSVWAHAPETAALTLSVNVSAKQFRQIDFVDQVLTTIHRHGIDARKLKLEITESLLLDNVEDIITKITTLKARGVGVSLDDFGTGYSSLAYLQRLPLDQLKIDQSFVRDVLESPNAAAIARAIVALAHSLGMSVLAEGVETEDQLLFLVTHNCHAFQGYLFSRPLPIDEFERYARSPGFWLKDSG